MNTFLKNELTNKICFIKNKIVENFNPDSIILLGSFAKKEVATFFDGEKINILSDCEICIIKRKPISRKKISNFNKKISKETGIDVSIWYNNPIKFVSPIIKRPTIANYDLKNGSRVIYGKNYLNQVPDFKPEQIPIWQGIRLIFNRMYELINNFSTEYLITIPNGSKETKLLYSISKLILACQDTLLLCAKKYHHSYKIKNKMFVEIDIPSFNFEQLSDLKLLASQATEYKLNPNKNIYSKNIIELWFDVAFLCDKVFRFAIKKDMGFNFNTYLQFQEKYLKHPNIEKQYFQDFSGLAIYQNIKGILYLLMNSRNMCFKLVKYINVPWIHIIYSLAPLIYFSLFNNGEINKSYIIKVRKDISTFSFLKEYHNNVYTEWDYVKQKTYNLWRIICY